MTDPNHHPRTEPERERRTVLNDRASGNSAITVIGIVVVLLVVLGFGYMWMTGTPDATSNGDVDVIQESTDVTPPETAPPATAPADTAPAETAPADTPPADSPPAETAPEAAPPAVQ